MGGVGLMGEMITQAFRQEAQSLLGGDLEVRLSTNLPSKEEKAYFDTLGHISEVTTLRTMTRVRNMRSLAEIKAVDAQYPLIGEVVLEGGRPLQELLKNGGVVVDPSLLLKLECKVGDTIQIGSQSYTIRGILKIEPDRAVQLFSFGPRIMMSRVSLEKSGLISALSLMEHRIRILLDTRPKDMEAYERQIEEVLAARFPDKAWRIISTTDGNASVDRVIDQLISFLSLSALATFLIAGIGISSSVRYYLEKKMMSIAVLKVLGGSARQIVSSYAVVLFILASVSGAIGALIAVGIVKFVVPFIISFVPTLKGHAIIYAKPLIVAGWYGVCITFTFSLPALLSAAATKSSLLFRIKIGLLKIVMSPQVVIALSALASLLIGSLVYFAADRLFMSVALIIIVTSFLIFYLCTLVMRWLVARIKSHKPWVRLAVGNMIRPGGGASTVVYAVGISLSVLITLVLAESNFQRRLTEIIENDAPTLFMFDIFPTQKDDLRNVLSSFAEEGNIRQLPMVRGRITHKNGEPITEDDVSPDVRWALLRDRGLSYSKTAPPGTEFTEGSWWAEDYRGKPLLSVDARFMKGMGLTLGDTLTFNILGNEIEATVSSARKIDYSTFQINFALMLSPGVIEQFPATYLTTVHLADLEKEMEVMNAIASQFPNVTIISTIEVVQVVEKLVSNAARTLTIAIGVSLFAGLLVLVSALGATLESRIYDIAIVKVMGARKRDIIRSCLVEWALITFVTAGFASVIGTVSSWLVVMRLRGQSFHLMPSVSITTIVLCFLVIATTGYAVSGGLFNVRPARYLRNE